MNTHDQCAATIRIISYNINRSSTAVTALLNSACKSADIILIQEVNITNPRYEVTHPNIRLVKPPKGQR
jgi:exonuclease III